MKKPTPRKPFRTLSDDELHAATGGIATAEGPRSRWATFPSGVNDGDKYAAIEFAS
jgi:hypothetical protein